MSKGFLIDVRSHFKAHHGIFFPCVDNVSGKGEISLTVTKKWQYPKLFNKVCLFNGIERLLKSRFAIKPQV